MMFNVAQLMKESVGAVRRYEVTEGGVRIDDAVGATESVEGSAKLTRTNTGILVDAELHSRVTLECSRCLREFAAPLDLRFREEFQPVIDVSSGLPLPPPEDQSVFTIDGHHVLDLSEAFRQYALLSLPLAPVCDPACLGLCPTCGQNWNEGRCQCKPVGGDPRWEELARFLEKPAWGADAGSGEGHHKRKR